MIEMAGVVANLVDVRSDLDGQAVILLQIDRQVGLGLFANLGQGRGVLAVIYRDPHHVRARVEQRIDLADRGGDILRVRGRHALHGHRIFGANGT